MDFNNIDVTYFFNTSDLYLMYINSTDSYMVKHTNDNIDYVFSDGSVYNMNYDKVYISKSNPLYLTHLRILKLKTILRK